MDKRVVIGVVGVVVAVVAIVFSGALGGGGGGGTATPTPIVAASPTPSVAPSGPPGTIAIRASFGGTTPEPRKIRKTTECGSDPLLDEEILVTGGKLANVLVRVIAGAPAAEGTGTGAEVVQEKCVYRPRVTGVVAGQSIAVTSKDAFLHNVHTFKGDVSIFNKGQSSPGTFTKEAADFVANGEVVKNGPITFKCDVHPWMVSHVVVNPNAHFAVTGIDGVAKLELPAGTYTIEAWHEKFGTRKVDVTVQSEKVAELGFEFP